MSVKLDPRWFVAAGLVVAVGAVALYVFKKGGLGQAAAAAGAAAGAAAVQVVDGAVTGAVGQVGASVGLPLPSETVDDPAVVRWIIDQYGYFTASKWATATALVRGAWMSSGSGTPPSTSSAVARGLGFTGLTLGDFTRMDHDLTPTP